MAYTYSEKNGIYPTISTPHSIPTPTPTPTSPVDPDIRDPNDMNRHLRVRKI